MRRFFHVMTSVCAVKFDSEGGPGSVAALAACESQYSQCGFPGCIGSADVVHIAWDRCPAESTSNYTGKEGFVTIAFQCTVDHCTRIMHVVAAQPGARNGTR